MTYLVLNWATVAAIFSPGIDDQWNEVRRLQIMYDDDLPAAAHKTLDALMDNLQQVNIARQYFKPIYIRSIRIR